MKRVIVLSGVVCLIMGISTLQAESLKIDFSRPGGRVEAGFEGYFANHESPASFTSQSYSAFGATVTITPTWAAGATAAAMQSYLRPEWATIEHMDLLIDWIGTDTRQPGDPLTLTISGLPAGTYAWLSYHHDTANGATSGYQTGLFDVTVNDATGSATTTGVDISSSSTLAEDIVTFADVTTFTTQLVSDRSDITLVFHQQVSNPLPQAFFAMNGFEIIEVFPPAAAKNPFPADGATDVPTSVILSWTPGDFAPPVNGHKVFLSDNFADVDEGLVVAEQGIVSDPVFDTAALPFALEFGTTYYWRVDEAKVPSGTWDAGSVWNFTVEPVALLLAGEKITATASSSNTADEGPENTVNGSGLDADGLHSDDDKAMWRSNITGPQPTWIQYEFDRVYRLYEMLIWNHNTSTEPVIGYGIKEAVIEYSLDGAAWTTLGTTHEFARAPGGVGYAPNTTIELSNVAAKYVKITANSNWGGLIDQYGLSEIRFFYIPVSAREPSPESRAMDVHPEVSLSWRAGRNAATHDVYLSTDEQAVIDGNVPTESVTDTGYSKALDLASTYYWRIDEVNEAETPTTWPGDVWSFSTLEFLVVDDFESYNNIDPPDPESHRIFESWSDGFQIASNGALVGSDFPPYLETTIVHGGTQSMPVFYSNTAGAVSSEVTYTLAPAQDWTKYGIQTLGLWFYGVTGNTGQLYVKINGVKIPSDGEAGNLTIPIWQAWNIDLTTAGANLASVTSLAIGIDGNGAAGTLYFDDIRLYAYARQLTTPVDPGTATLLAQYQFEGNGNDSVGTHDGTVMGEPEYVAGKDGQAMHFDGINNYVEIAPFKYTNDQGEFSLTLWFKIKSLEATTRNNAFPHLFNHGMTGSNNSLSIHFRTATFELRSQGRLMDPTDPEDVAGTTGLRYIIDIPVVGLVDGQWHMYSITLSAVDGYTVYIDGKIASENPDYKGAMVNLVNPIRLGNRFDDTRFFGDLDPDSGLLDDVRLYERALSPEEIAWLGGWTEPFDKPF